MIIITKELFVSAILEELLELDNSTWSFLAVCE